MRLYNIANNRACLARRFLFVAHASKDRNKVFFFQNHKRKSVF